MATEPVDAARHGLWLHRYAVLTAGATFLLIVAGGLVTSTDSGLAVPDWPLSYGMLFPPMIGGIFYEHGHRMIAGAVGIMTFLLAFWLVRAESRAWVRRLGILSTVGIVVQAVLGGITVLWMLPPAVSIGHLGVAMGFFAMVTTIAVVTSRGWATTALDSNSSPSPLPRFAALVTAAAYAQILLGAAMRHLDAGLACPDFPLCRGALLPDIDSLQMGLHLAHRGGALVVLALVVALVDRAWKQHPEASELRRPALAALVLVLLQVLLGALTVLSQLSVSLTTAHVGGGALLLASLVVLTLRAYRRLGRRDGRPVGEPVGADGTVDAHPEPAV